MSISIILSLSMLNHVMSVQQKYRAVAAFLVVPFLFCPKLEFIVSIAW